MINQDHIEDLLKLSNPANMSGRKMWVHDGGNMMTAMNWFKKITGREFLLPIPVGGPGTAMPGGAAQSTGVGALISHTEQIGGKDVTVTLRGGSSSTLDGAWGNPHQGPPTLEIQDARHLTGVPTCQPFASHAKKIIVEVKFTTRADQTRVAIK